MVFGPPQSGAEDVAVGNAIVGTRVTSPNEASGVPAEGVHVDGNSACENGSNGPRGCDANTR